MEAETKNEKNLAVITLISLQEDSAKVAWVV